MFRKSKNNSGQAVLIVLLSLSVVLIIVLYIMSRSITDISLSNKDEDSMRAFSAAEAGIERALIIGSDIGDTTIGDANFSADVSEFGQGDDTVVYPMSLKSGEIATFWFNRPSDLNVFDGSRAKICWGTATTEPPAVEVSTYYLEGGIYKISRVALDPLAVSRTPTNYFTAATTGACTVDNEQFRYYSTVSLPTVGTLQFMTVKPLYNTTVSHKIGIDVSNIVNDGSLLPSQGVKINSDGSFAGANRSIEVYQLHPVAPSIFMNAVYSSSGITK